MYKILIVDDEPSVHTAIRALVDWQQLCASNPLSAYTDAEGLRLMEAEHPDIAFVDMNMPVIGGEHFMETVARSHPYCRMIVVSGYNEFRYAKSAIQFGVVEYLLKPIDGDELLAAVQKAIRMLPERTRDIDEDNADEVIAAVKDYLDHHFDEEISMEILADKFYFSKEYLNKLFHNRFGCPIYEYVLQVRMDKAAEYLADPRMQIQEIAGRLGYANANYFSKAFKHRYAVTPSDFRSQHSGE